MKWIVTALSLAALGLCGSLVRAEEKARDTKEDKQSLVGTYVIVGGEKFGQKEPKERIQGDTVRFTEDTVTVTDNAKKEAFSATYKVDWSKKPYATILMTSTRAPVKGQVARGLIEKNGDTVRLIYAEPGADMPTEFKTRDKQLMFVLKAMKP